MDNETIDDDSYSADIMKTMANCSPPALDQFPSFFFSNDQREHGAIIIHVIIASYMVYGLMVVCESYFVPSLKCICHILHLQPNVAGATFMAIGTSAPEFFTAIIGSTIAKDNIGLGTMVGSAAFNLTFLIGFISLATGEVAHLSKWPLIRDSVCYVFSVAIVSIVILDRKVYWYEALILIILYGMYILLMYFNPNLTRLTKKLFQGNCQMCDSLEREEKENTTLALQQDSHYNSIDRTKSVSSGRPNTNESPRNMRNGSVASDSKGLGLDEKDEVLQFTEIKSPLKPPEEWWKRILWVISLPLCLILFITLPDCREQRWRKWFMVTFLMSTVWLSLLSYIMVWTITVIGFTLHIPDDVMGLVFLGPATSIPDLVGSFMVARDGYWDMAVSSCVGSNVFELLMCLGVSWFISSFLPPFVNHHVVQMMENGLLYVSMMLLATIMITNTSIIVNGWKLDKSVGTVLVSCYIVFVIFAILYEIGIFGHVGLPTCYPAN
ncbi:sodium/potassium/calcium exchanger 5-like [Glandiceps talaboti]